MALLKQVWAARIVEHMKSHITVVESAKLVIPELSYGFMKPCGEWNISIPMHLLTL